MVSSSGRAIGAEPLPGSASGSRSPRSSMSTPLGEALRSEASLSESKPAILHNILLQGLTPRLIVPTRW